MTVQFTKDQEAILEISLIVKRARSAGIADDPMSLHMDLSAVHMTCPLKLNLLRRADEFNFIHDVCGIQRHLNRATGQLEDFFVPRYAE